MLYPGHQVLKISLKLCNGTTCPQHKKINRSRFINLDAHQFQLHLVAILLDGPLDQSHLAFLGNQSCGVRRVELACYEFVATWIAQFQVKVGFSVNGYACLRPYDKQPAAYGASCLQFADDKWFPRNLLFPLK